MKAILQRFSLVIFLLIILITKTSATTYDWVGTSLTSGVYNWNNRLNWQVAGVTATTVPGAGDIVQIAVNAYTNDPTITDARSCAAIILGVYGNLNVTVNGTLTVSGDITQKNDPNFFQYTTLTGTGTIVCNNFNLGDNTQPTAKVCVVNSISSQVNQLTINGNLVLNAAGDGVTDAIEYPFFSLDANKLTLYGKIVTTTFNNPLFGGVNDPLFPGIGLFQADSYATATTIELQNATPVATPIVPGFTVDFTNNGPGIGTVIYDAPTGTQQVYTTGTTGLGVVLYNYDYLVFAGGSTKTVVAGAFTVGNNLTSGTGPVDLSTYNPTVTIGGNWINSSTVTQGSGIITLTNGLQNSGNITLGAGAFTLNGATHTNSGTLTGGTGTVKISGSFQNSGTFKCGGGNVIFNGNYTNSNIFTASTGAVYFSGAAQTLIDNSAAGTMFTTVVFNGSGTKTISPGVGNFSVSSTGSLSMISPAKLVAGSASVPYLTLKSDVNGSATISAITGTSSITGFVNVQRFLKGGDANHRSYRLLSSPVYASTVASNNVYSLNYLKSVCYLTGTTGTIGGFDKPGNPTLYLFRENIAPNLVSFSGGNFRGISNLTLTPGYLIDNEVGTFNIPVGNGFLFFFRGNRSTSLASKTVSPFAIPENTTVSTAGNLNQGQITVHNWYTPASANLGFTNTTGNTLVKGFNLVGNPYASSINWDLFNTTTTTSGIYGSAVGTTIYVYDPSSKNYGAYTKGVGTGTHNASAILPSGQGFFVVTTAATAKLIFNESAKVYTQATGLNLLMGRPTEYVVNQSLRLQLAQDSVNTDDLLIRFSNNAGAAYDPEVDAPYKQGYGAVSLASLSSDKVPLAINLQPSPKKRETIALSANAINDGTYKLSLTSIKGIPQLFDIWLVDGYTRDSVNMRKTPDYSFSILKSDTNTYGSKRFKLVLSENADYAYKLVDFAASKIASAPSKQVQVTWTALNEQNYTSFTLERSIDTGKTYEVLHGVQSSGQGTYSFIDKYPVTGQNLYRLKQDDINDSVSYSKIIPVEFSNLSNSLVKNNVNVYPNPASSVINLTISPDIKAAAYKIHITNSLGMLVKEVTSAQPNWQSSVKELQNGTYFIKVVNSQDQTLIGQTKFVKL